MSCDRVLDVSKRHMRRLIGKERQKLHDNIKIETDIEIEQDNSELTTTAPTAALSSGIVFIHIRIFFLI